MGMESTSLSRTLKTMEDYKLMKGSLILMMEEVF